MRPIKPGKMKQSRAAILLAGLAVVVAAALWTWGYCFNYEHPFSRILKLASRTKTHGEIPLTDLAPARSGSSYVIRAGGPRSFVRITNAPASNPVSIALAEASEGSATFRLTNSEHHAILLWNVRVQVRSAGPGTDGFGWDTVNDDYPSGTPGHDSAHYAPGASGEFQVQAPDDKPWRVCIVYSTDWTDSGTSYSGNYEVISQELK